MKRDILLGLLVLTFFSCRKDENKSSIYPIAISFSTVAKGDNINTHRTNPFGRNSIISNQQQWNNTLTKLDSLILPVNPNIFQRFVDFNTKELIYIIDSVRYEGGWTVDIISVNEFQNTIEVKIDNLAKSNDATEVRQPYHIIQIPKQTKTIIYKN